MSKVTWEGRGRLVVSDDTKTAPAPERDDDVVLRVTASGVCSTDVHIVGGSLRLTDPPLVLGHEFAGVVEACGGGVTRVVPGDRVKCDSVAGCGVCEWCRSGATQFCQSGWEFGITRDGSWRRWMVVPERCLYRLPASISDEEAALLDVEVFSALGKPGVALGDTVAVFGCGPAGLMAAQFARVFGAGRVILIGLNASRLALGAKLGADVTIDASKTGVVGAIREATGGEGVDLAVEAAGVPQTVKQLVEVLRPQGKAVFYGIHGGPLPEFDINQVILKDLVIYGALSNRCGWGELIDLVTSGRVNLSSLITHRFPLEQAPAAVECARQAKDGMVKAVLLH